MRGGGEGAGGAVDLSRGREAADHTVRCVGGGACIWRHVSLFMPMLTFLTQAHTGAAFNSPMHEFINFEPRVPNDRPRVHIPSPLPPSRECTRALQALACPSARPSVGGGDPDPTSFFESEATESESDEPPAAEDDRLYLCTLALVGRAWARYRRGRLDGARVDLDDAWTAARDHMGAGAGAGAAKDEGWRDLEVRGEGPDRLREIYWIAGNPLDSYFDK